MNQGLEKIPFPIFGTWRLGDVPETVDTIVRAVDAAGYRHLDTAAHYGNENRIGQAVATCGVPREDLFICTKLSNGQRGYETTKEDCQRALDVMKLEYVDLYLMHWPAPKAYFENWAQINADTWRAMEELQSDGKVKYIGVSNFKINQLEELLKTAKIIPLCNQIKLYPGVWEQQRELVEWCQMHDIAIQAYSPLCAGKILDNPLLAEVAKKYKKSITQVCLRWNVQHGGLPIAKASSLKHMLENADLFSFELDSVDMKRLDSMPGVPTEIPDSELVWRD